MTAPPCGHERPQAKNCYHCAWSRRNPGKTPPSVTSRARSGPLSLPCVHEGAVVEWCHTCTGERGHIRDCELHDRCTRGDRKKAVQCCLDCPDYLAPPEPPARFEWISTADLARDSVILAGKLPPDCAGVAGIPRSGMIPASVIATILHLPLYEFTESGGLRRLGHGRRGHHLPFRNTGGPVAIIDDTTYGGVAMRRARQAATRHGVRAVFGVVYHKPGRADGSVDFFARELPSPHLLEWNLSNNGPTVGNAVNRVYGRGVAFDMDGIIVHDSESGGVVGTPYIVPRTLAVPLIATGRHERHRAITVSLLKRWGVKYARMEMLPDHLPQTVEVIAEHKARHYKASGCGFFLESEHAQAELIHRLTGKPVIHPRSGRVYH